MLVPHMFKTASFRLHEPSNHKVAMLKYAMTQYHTTLASLISKCLADPTFEERTSTTLKSGRVKADTFKIEKEGRKLAPKAWSCAPLKDYVLNDLSACLSSYFELKRDETRQTNPPVLPSLDPPTDEFIEQATADFAATVDVLADCPHRDASGIYLWAIRQRTDRYRVTHVGETATSF